MFVLSKGQHLIVIGTSGAGKTVQGQRIALRLDIPFFDNDREIERHVGLPIDEIFRCHRESGFRKFETERLSYAVVSGATGGSMVVATGGGIVTVPENLELLRKGRILWLDVTLEIILNRLAKKTDRPLAATTADIERRYYQRRELYETLSVHGYRVRIDRDMEKDEVTQVIFETLGI